MKSLLTMIANCLLSVYTATFVLCLVVGRMMFATTPGTVAHTRSPRSDTQPDTEDVQITFWFFTFPHPCYHGLKPGWRYGQEARQERTAGCGLAGGSRQDAGIHAGAQ